MAGGVLLHAPANVVHDLGRQFHHVEGVEDGAGVVEVVVDGVLVSVERVERGHRDTSAEDIAALVEPAGVGGAGTAGEQVQQPSPDVPVSISGQVHQPGQLLRAAPTLFDGLGRHGMPHVLIHPEDDHPVCQRS